MPMYHEAQQIPIVGVRASAAVELDWVLATGHTPGRTGNPVLEGLYRQNPSLADAVRDLWGPDETLSYPGYLEISVLAHRAGVLFTTDSSELLDGLDDAARAGGPDLPFVAERPEDRVKLHRRLDLLRRSPKRRRHYLEVAAQAWSLVRPEWEEFGLPAVEATIADVKAQLDRGRPWEQFAKSECAPPLEVMTSVGPPGNVVIVPAWFTHGGMLVDLQDLVVIGVRTGSAPGDARARTEGLARNLKVISDPTRLAILDALNREKLTVTELANRFSLAQPTVSNHVKVMRDAGIVVSDTRSGSRRALSVNHAVVDEAVRGLRDLLDLDET